MAKSKKSSAPAKAAGKNTKQIKLGIALMMPLILVLGVIPLVVHMQLVPISAEVQPFWKENYATDFFSYYKSRLLILTAIYMVCAFAYYKSQGLKDTIFKDKSMYIYFGGTAVFALFAILSTLLAQYKSVALWGAPERCEGLGMILIYVLIMLYALWAYLHKPEFRYIVLPLGILTAITTFLGVFQFFGHDLFTTEFGQMFIVPAMYRAQGTLQLLFPRGKIYGTMYHYNYMGSFGAMMAPLFLVLALFLKDRKAKLFCGIMTALSLFLLLGSTSRAGIIGLALAAVCFIIFFGKKLVQHAKYTIVCVAALLVLVLGVNIVTDGLALARIPSLLNDMKAIVSSSDIDYHDEIPVRNIDLQADSTTFTFRDNTTLEIRKNAQNVPVFITADGKQTVAPAENATVHAAGQKLELQYVEKDGVKTPYLGLYIGKNIEFILGLFDDEFSFVDSRMNRIEYVEAPYIGFEGKERLGSARGYIWSRSLPMLFDHMLIGTGPDTYFAEFPQGDYLA
ncbi:MAG: O-antigen ligase family protein, partial [Peptococcaceae bacterium]|nr:O-antigen ligase family protein [Peptococcaceae bacterium]